ncbi:MAG: sulfatase [Fimbriimonadaceae bacterium]|nr:sulfatase [Fimbriimonadaceae bacterium]
MRSTHAIGVAILCVLAFRSGASDLPSGTTQRPKPNIVFILVDDMGWKDVGCYGSRYYQTPNIDRLAKTSARFTQAYAAAAVCSPTRASILTGKYPARLHLTDWISGEGAPKNSKFTIPKWQQSLPLSETTLPEALKRQGYATASIGKWHLGGPDSSPEKHGFDLNIAGGHIGHPASFFWPYGAPGNSHRVPGIAETGGQKGEFLTDRLTDEALRFMDSSRDKPFFLYLPFYAVHAPLMGKPELVSEAGERTPSGGQGNPRYAAMVKSVDDGVGRILERLDRLGLADNTVVIFTSDNGGAVHFGKPPATSNAPLRLGKGFAYEGGLRVPLIIRAPGLTGGQTVNTPVISNDFYPTLLDLCKLPKADSVDGLSLVPLLKGAKALKRDELFWHYPHYWNGGVVSPYSIARVGDYKLIRFYESGTEELYNLASDGSERHDLANAKADVRKKLSARLDLWLKEVGAQMPVPR